MANWFNLKVSFDKTLANGLIRRVTEHYLVDALSFTEVETSAIVELKPYISGEFGIAGITLAHLSEIFFNETGDRFYKAKVQYVTFDEKTASEKLTAVNKLVQATDFDEAVAGLKKGMQGTMADWRLVKMEETAIMDVFPYKAEGKEEE